MICLSLPVPVCLVTSGNTSVSLSNDEHNWVVEFVGDEGMFEQKFTGNVTGMLLGLWDKNRAVCFSLHHRGIMFTISQGRKMREVGANPIKCLLLFFSALFSKQRTSGWH